MEFVEVVSADLAPAFTASDWKKDQALIGNLVETKVASTGGKIYTVNLQEPTSFTKKGQTYDYKKGDQVKIWGSTIIDDRLEDVSALDTFKLLCLGSQKPQKAGGKPYINFKLFLAKVEEEPDFSHEPD